MPDAYCEINGQSGRIAGGSYSIVWGTQPGVCGLAVGYSFAAVQPGDVVTCELKFRDFTVKIRDALVVDPRASGSVTQSPVVNFSVLDRRWKWIHAGRIYGSYNVESRAAVLQREKTPRELAEILFTALGEPVGGFDVAGLPNDARPQKVWDAADPRAELESLCAELGCVPIFDPIADKFKIAKIGIGTNPPSAADDKVISISISSATPPQPSAFRGVGGVALFQSVLTLAEPVGREVSGAFKPINELSYAPQGGWQTVDPWDFKQIETTYTDPATGATLYHRDLAESSVWRMYRLGGQASGGWSPAALFGSPYAPTSIKDIGPFTGGLLDRDPVTGERLPSYVRGVFADERLGYDNCDPNTRFPGSISIDNERRIVSFDRPLWKYGEDGKPYRADVVLVAAYAVSKDAVPIRWEYSAGNVGNFAKGGEFVEVRDEVVREVIEQPAGTFGGSDNITAVNNQLRYYLEAASLSFQTSQAVNATFGGLKDLRLDGQLRSISWEFSAADVPTTKGAWNGERSKAIIPWEKRNEARQLRRGRQLLRYAEAAKLVAASREAAQKTP